MPTTNRRDPGKRQRQALERRIQSALTTIYDPATPNIDLFNMGMVYSIRIEADGAVDIEMAYSSPGHPGYLGLPRQVESTINELEGVSQCRVKVVADPPWTMDRVSDHARINMSADNYE